MQEVAVFEFRNYKEYLLALIGAETTRTGLRSNMARAMGCQLTYFSQVLKGKKNLSLEQAEKLGRLLGLSAMENNYFLLLVQRERAGTKELQEHFDQQLSAAMNDRLNVKKRLGPQGNIQEDDQNIYYCSWQNAAVHMALTIPELKSREALAKYFQIPLKQVSTIIDFLLKAGLIERSREGFSVKMSSIRLGNDSPNILKHHTNWRAQAVESLERESISDLHYSGVVTISRDDALKIKDQILEDIKKMLKIIRESPEEEVHCFSVDFFNMKRGI